VDALRKFAEAMRRDTPGIDADLDRYLEYLEDVLMLRRFQRGERQGDEAEDPPAG
jgi:hypothetical protein